MSRRHRVETTDRLKRGDSHERNNANVSSAVHARSSVYFLNSDTPHGVTTLDRAPSLNRLHAQSSTETSGLGETVTSGFSSQESVHSHHGDDKDRIGVSSNFLDPSKIRGRSSPSGVLRLVDHEFPDRNFSAQTAPQEQHLNRLHQHQHLAVPVTFKWPINKDLDKDVAERSNSDFAYLKNNQSGHRSKSIRDSGGRSLTPEQAKAELDERHRKLERGSVQRAVVLSDTRRRGNTSNNSVKQRRPHSAHRSKACEDKHLAENKDTQFSNSNVDNRDRLGFCGCSRDTSVSNCKHLQESPKCDRTDIVHLAAGSPRSKCKESPANRLQRPRGRSISQESVEAPDKARSKSGSGENVFYSLDKNNPGLSGGGDRRSGPNTRDACKPRGSNFRPVSNDNTESLKTGFQTGIFNPESSEFRINFQTIQGSYKEQAADEIESRTCEQNRRYRRYYSSDVAEPESKASVSSEKFTGSQKGTRVSVQGFQEVHRWNSCDKHNSPGSKRNDIDSECLSTSSPIEQKNYSTNVGSIVKDIKVHVREESEISNGYNIYENSGTSNYDNLRPLRSLPDDNQVRIQDLRNFEATDIKKVDTRNFDIQEDNYDPDLKSVRRIEIATKSDGQPSDVSVRRQRKRVVSSRDLNQNSETGSEFSNISVTRHSRNKDSTKQSESGLCIGKGRIDSRHDGGSLPCVQEDDTASICNEDCVKIDRDVQERMDYDRLFHQARSGLSELGGASMVSGEHNRYSVSFAEGYTTSKGSDESGLFRSSSVGQSLINSSTAMQGISINIVGANSSESSASKLKSATSTTFQLPVSPKGSVPTVQLTSSPDVPGLNLAHIDKEWERRGSKCSNRSHNSKSSGKTSNRFLGINTGSAWTKWSKDRRASYRRRIEKLAREEPAAQSKDIVRISTPIKKARQEGLKFIHPDLEASYLSEDDLKELRRHKQQQVQAMRVIERSRRNKFRLKTEVKLNSEQLHMLHEFWDHGLFVRARYLGVLVSLVAFIFMMVSITNHSWVKHSEYSLIFS